MIHGMHVQHAGSLSFPLGKMETHSKHSLSRNRVTRNNAHKLPANIRASSQGLLGLRVAQHNSSQISLDSHPTSVGTGRETLGKLLHSLSLSFGEMNTMLLPAHGENARDTLTQPSGRPASAGGGTDNPHPQK